MANPVLAEDFASRFKETYASPLTVKREAVYAFAEKPVITRPARDRVEIAFASKGWCDVTVAVEDQNGRIVRHLASGVLGPKAPDPFQKDSLRQKIVWDGKNDKGEYVDDKDSHTIRVSLGLKAQFERTLYYSPYKRYGGLGDFGVRIAWPTIILAAGPGGFYVHDHHGDETIRLYDRNGDYVRTVYPFPADKADQVKMPRRTYPDGLSVLAKRGYFLATLLTGTENGQPESTIHISSEATALHVRGTRLALAGLRLNRMTTDGTSGGLDLYGPVVQGAESHTPVDYFPKQPHALAFSPDGRYLYLTGYVWAHCDLSGGYAFGYWAHAVLRMEYAKNDPPQVFLGKETERGSDDAHFDHPTDIATDDAGRLYVADHVNGRVQIFSPEGKLLKSLAVEGPAKVRLNEKTQELYVFSYFIGRNYRPPFGPLDADIKPTLRVFAPFPGLEPRQACPIPLRAYGTTTGTNSAFTRTNMHYQFALDSAADPPRILAILEEGANPELLELRKEGLVKVRDFLDDAKKSGVGLDADDNVYANCDVSLMWQGKPYYKVVGHRFDQVGTLAKFAPGAGKFMTRDAFIPLEKPPDRPPELDGFWVDGAEWFYPGVGRSQWTMDCSCWNSRVVLDYFARTFAPEYDRFSIAVLDTNGNLITRIGRYGNVEDGKALIAAGGPPNVRSIGGDEVGLFDACYVATHTDRRLFIADAGNNRLLSVKLDYSASESVALRNVKEKS